MLVKENKIEANGINSRRVATVPKLHELSKMDKRSAVVVIHTLCMGQRFL